MSRPTQIKHSKNNDLVSEFNFSYSFNGNISQILEKATGLEKLKSYQYDSLNRLTTATGEDAFVYDLLGNRTDYGASYNLINQRIEDNKYTFSHDIRGDLTERANKLTSEKLQLTWNNQNQLVQIDKLKGTAQEYSKLFKYDSLNRRIETQYTNYQDQTKNYTRKLIYDNEDIILELDENNQPVVFYVHGAGVDEPLAMVRDLDHDFNFEATEVFYFTKDHLNSVRELLNYNGSVYQKYSYSAYGETKIEKHQDRTQHDLIENRYAYTSREIDEHTGLYYYRARWYSPEQGQFLSEDPIGFESKDSNFYRYVFNNPMLFTDPDGLDVFKCKRPLEGMPFMIGALNHTFLCVNKYCNGQTSSTGSSSPNPGTPSNDPTPQSPPPGSPNGTTPGGGGVACTKVKPPKNKKKCFEKCTLKKLQTPIRPVYGIPFGTDCQEFAEETVESCFERCSNE